MPKQMHMLSVLTFGLILQIPRYLPAICENLLHYFTKMNKAQIL